MTPAVFEPGLTAEMLATWTAAWPPGLNHLYPTRGKRRVLSAEGRQWKDIFILHLRAGPLALLAAHVTADGVYALDLRLCPPDNRRYDADGRVKIVQDTLCQELGFDDSRIVDLAVKKCKPFPQGRVIVTLSQLTQEHKE